MSILCLRMTHNIVYENFRVFCIAITLYSLHTWYNCTFMIWLIPHPNVILTNFWGQWMYARNEYLGCNIHYHQRLPLFTALCLHEPNLKLHDQQQHQNLTATPFRSIRFKSVSTHTHLTFSCTRVHSLKTIKPHMVKAMPSVLLLNCHRNYWSEFLLLLHTEFSFKFHPKNAYDAALVPTYFFLTCTTNSNSIATHHPQITRNQLHADIFDTSVPSRKPIAHDIKFSCSFNTIYAAHTMLI
jgi:hypothetical protein